jgi:hypothetical protein
MAKLAKGKKIEEKKTPTQVLLELSSSWDDPRSSEEIVAEIRRSRKKSRNLEEVF